MTLQFRSATMTPTRRAMMVAGVATVAVSLILSIAPTLAKNANSGTVKVHDGTTGLAVNANDPKVCSFWISFSDPDAAESGTWQLLDWPPTGTKTIVDSGTYDTTGDGEDATPTLTPAEGHYRFEWTATGANSDSKTLWVEDSCGAESAAATATPTPTPSESESEAVTPTPTPSESESEAVTPTPTPSESESEAVTPTPTPSESESEAVTPTPTPSESESEAVTPTPTPSESESEAVEPATSTPSPSQSAAGDPAETPATTPAEVPAATPAQTPEQEVESGRSTGATSLPNTATPQQLTGLLAAIGVLLIVAAHASTRRSKLPERA